LTRWAGRRWSSGSRPTWWWWIAASEPSSRGERRRWTFPSWLGSRIRPGSAGMGWRSTRVTCSPGGSFPGANRSSPWSRLGHGGPAGFAGRSGGLHGWWSAARAWPCGWRVSWRRTWATRRSCCGPRRSAWPRGICAGGECSSRRTSSATWVARLRAWSWPCAGRWVAWRRQRTGSRPRRERWSRSAKGWPASRRTRYEGSSRRRCRWTGFTDRWKGSRNRRSSFPQRSRNRRARCWSWGLQGSSCPRRPRSSPSRWEP
jgi:hypothetical protein